MKFDERGAWTCEECGEEIPGDTVCYEVAGKHYCEECMRACKVVAPYLCEIVAEEVDW